MSSIDVLSNPNLANNLPAASMMCARVSSMCVIVVMIALISFSGAKIVPCFIDLFDVSIFLTKIILFYFLFQINAVLLCNDCYITFVLQ